MSIIERNPIIITASQCSDHRCGDTINKGFYTFILCDLFEGWGQQNRKEVTREKCGYSGNGRTGKSGYEIPDKTYRNDNGTRSNHGYGNGIHKLRFGKPLKFFHNPAMQKRHNSQSASENERTSLGKENPYFH